MTADSGQDGPVDLAARRLDRAVSMLEQRIGRRLAEAGNQAGAAADQDRANLAAELDAARARERDLEEAATAAYDALAGAIAEIRQVLGEPATAEQER